MASDRATDGSLGAPPASLRVELVASAPPGEAPVEYALTVQSVGRVARGAIVGFTCVNVAAAVAAPGVGSIVTAAAFGSWTYSLFKDGRQTLTVYDRSLVWKQQRHALEGVTRVTASFASAWIWHGDRRCLAFEGTPRQIRWVARLLREVVRVGRLPPELTLPSARAT